MDFVSLSKIQIERMSTFQDQRHESKMEFFYYSHLISCYDETTLELL